MSAESGEQLGGVGLVVTFSFKLEGTLEGTPRLRDLAERLAGSYPLVR
jgi:hypothetical protein